MVREIFELCAGGEGLKGTAKRLNAAGAETAAKGGAVPVILEALKHREADRRRLQAELTACAAEPAVTRKPAHVLRAQLRGFLDDWQELLSGNVAEARPLLHVVLADRIGFTPTADRGYQLTVPVVFDRNDGGAGSASGTR